MAKRIGDKFKFVAQIVSKNEKKLGETVGLKVGLKERDGKEFDWTSFSTSAFDGYQVEDFIKVEAFFTENTKGKYPFRNIETDTPIEKASETQWSLAPRPNAQGEIIQPQAGRSGMSGPSSTPEGLLQSWRGTPSDPHARNGESPGRSESIERQSSVNAAAKVCDLIASHYGEYYTDLTQVLTHAEENLPQYLKLAGSIYDYYSNRAATGGQVPSSNGTSSNPNSANSGNPPQGRLEASESNTDDGLYEPPKLENIGHVLTGALKRWNLSQKQVCDFFGVDTAPEIANSYKMSEAWEALKANYDGPDGRV